MRAAIRWVRIDWHHFRHLGGMWQTSSVDTTVIEDDEMEYVLVVRHKDSVAGRQVRLTQYPFVIGRGSKVDLDLDTEKASRRHAEIAHVEGGWVVTDLESRNGTKMNGEPLTDAHTLSVGDVIGIGDFRLEWQAIHPERESILPPTVVLTDP